MTSRSLPRLGFHFSIAAISQGMYKRLQGDSLGCREHFAPQIAEAKPEGVRRGEESVAPGAGREWDRLREGEQKVCVKRSKEGGLKKKNPTLKAHFKNSGNSRKKQATYLNIETMKNYRKFCCLCHSLIGARKWKWNCLSLTDSERVTGLGAGTPVFFFFFNILNPEKKNASSSELNELMGTLQLLGWRDWTWSCHFCFFERGEILGFLLI